MEGGADKSSGKGKQDDKPRRSFASSVLLYFAFVCMLVTFLLPLIWGTDVRIDAPYSVVTYNFGFISFSSDVFFVQLILLFVDGIILLGFNAKKFESSGRIVIEVDYDLCSGVGECVINCPMDVYELVDDKAVAVNVDDCIECCACVEVCPNKAINHSSC